MAQALKHQFGAAIPERIAAMIQAVHPSFGARTFLEDVLDGYEGLELLPRARKIAHALRRHLPDDFPRACQILLASLGPKSPWREGMGMAPFLYLPHVLYVGEYGLGHFEIAMHAQYELTQRFSAEFSIRAYLERYPEATLARLRQWARDPNAQVRRLVSEGTRPRLPWAARLPRFQRDPRPVLALLELLKDDPELYVRRSVANNLNDIGKDHPELLAKTARRWLRGASKERRALIAHALRSALKRGEPRALDVLGFGVRAKVSLRSVTITPGRVQIGDRVAIGFEIVNALPVPQRLLVDLRMHFVKARGATSAKVFKLNALELAPRQRVRLDKTISLAQLTTRKHYPGTHAVEVLLNGEPRALGRFELTAGK